MLSKHSFHVKKRSGKKPPLPQCRHALKDGVKGLMMCLLTRLKKESLDTI